MRIITRKRRVTWKLSAWLLPEIRFDWEAVSYTEKHYISSIKMSWGWKRCSLFGYLDETLHVVLELLLCGLQITIHSQHDHCDSINHFQSSKFPSLWFPSRLLGATVISCTKLLLGTDLCCFHLLDYYTFEGCNYQTSHWRISLQNTSFHVNWHNYRNIWLSQSARDKDLRHIFHSGISGRHANVGQLAVFTTGSRN